MHSPLNAAAGLPTSKPSNGNNKRVFLVDRHPLVRTGMVYLLNLEPDLAVCGQTADVLAAMHTIEALRPHLVVLDLSLEDGSGFEVIEQIISRSPNTAVLVLSTHDEPHFEDRVLQAGAQEFVSKTEPTKKIIAALRCVLHGKAYLSPAAVQRVLGSFGSASVPACGSCRIDSLSNRELEIFAMTGRGLGTRRIADILHLSPKTIQAYHARIKDKLQLRDAHELLREAICWVEGVGCLSAARLH